MQRQNTASSLSKQCETSAMRHQHPQHLIKSERSEEGLTCGRKNLSAQLDQEPTQRACPPSRAHPHHKCTQASTFGLTWG